MAVIVVTKAFESFSANDYLAVGVVIALPSTVLPMWFQPSSEVAKPWWQRHWVKANVWLGILAFVGSYFWTHYFYTLLGAQYTFRTYCLNTVPIAMYLPAHAYFCLYHSATNMALRRWYTSHTYAVLPHAALRTAGTCVLVVVMAWVTAFMEAFSIQGFPYYHIADRTYMYTVGSIVYGIYFVVSFPMYQRLDEDAADDADLATAEAVAAHPNPAAADVKSPVSTSTRRRRPSAASAASTEAPIAPVPAVVAALATPPTAAVSQVDRRPWPMSRVVIDALAAAMAVTLLLDAWRLVYTAQLQPAGGAVGGGVVGQPTPATPQPGSPASYCTPWGIWGV